METVKQDRTALFLFNFATRQLHGAFVAASDGGLELVPNAWKSSHRSGFPSQVKMLRAIPFPPLPEKATVQIFGSRNKVGKLSVQQVSIPFIFSLASSCLQPLVHLQFYLALDVCRCMRFVGCLHSILQSR